MISIIQQPDKWTAVYEDLIYKFKDITNLGIFDVSDNGTFTNRVIIAGAGIVNFFIGQVVSFTAGSISYTTTVINIVGGDAILDLPPLFVTYTNISIQGFNNQPLNVTLKVGKLAAGVPMFTLATIRAVPLLGEYEVNLKGYLQDYFSNIAPPPVLGIDAELWCNYQLNNEPIRYGLYSTQPDVNSLAVGSLLRFNAVETFAGQGALYSRLLSNFVQNFTI
jgi:hypothetical protein